jgi:glucokinase
MNYLGIDLGGTNIVAAVVNEKFEIVSEAKNPTLCPRPWKEILDDVAKTALEAAKMANLEMSDFPFVGIGSPGVISVETGTVIAAVNLGFDNVPVSKYLSEKFEVPVILENDANAAAYGEFKAGKAKNTENFIAFTIGTGIGSGVVLDGKIYRGTNGIAGELGHSVIKLGGRQCSCGRKGCVDVYASATGLITTTKEAMEANKESLMWQLSEGDIKKVNGITAFKAARQNDKTALEVVNSYIEVLAAAITNIINTFQPDMITIAGGISKEGDFLLNPIKKLVEKDSLKNLEKPLPKIEIAELQDKAGVIGAALLGI